MPPGTDSSKSSRRQPDEISIGMKPHGFAKIEGSHREFRVMLSSLSVVPPPCSSQSFLENPPCQDKPL